MKSARKVLERLIRTSALLVTADDKLMYSLRAPKDVTLDTNPSLRFLAGC